MTKQEASKKLAELVSEAEAKLREAEDLAKEHKLSFGFHPAYGMGGTFIGDPEHNWYNSGEAGWISSSNNC